MRLMLAAVAGFIGLGAAETHAASLCNCCGSGTAQSCSTACAPVKVAEGQCVATVDFAAKAEIGPGKNPLYDVPLQNVWLGQPDASGLEAFRRLLEAARKGVEADRLAALKDYRKGTIDRTTSDARAKRYDDALVNYYLGIQAFRIARGR